MNEALSHAFDEAQKLSQDDQTALAAIILDEIADDRAWSNRFAESAQQLGRWAQRVRSDIESGRVSDAGFDSL